MLASEVARSFNSHVVLAPHSHQSAKTCSPDFGPASTRVNPCLTRHALHYPLYPPPYAQTSTLPPHKDPEEEFVRSYNIFPAHLAVHLLTIFAALTRTPIQRTSPRATRDDPRFTTYEIRFTLPALRHRLFSFPHDIRNTRYEIRSSLYAVPRILSSLV